MMIKPTISVVMTTYNHEEFITEAIDSVLDQTFQNFELIVIDDGSQDQTTAIISSYNDPRIKFLSQENSGPSIAFNKGFRQSSGDYIALMSGDDVCYKTRLENQKKQIEAYEADIVFTRPELISRRSNELSWSEFPPFFAYSFEDSAELYRRLFEHGNFLCAPSCFMRSSVIKEIGYFKRGLIQLQDFEYWIRACKNNLSIKLFNDPLIKYRVLEKGNLSSSKNLNRTRIEAMSIYRSFFDNVQIHIFKEAFKDVITLDTEIETINKVIDKAILLFNHSDPLIQSLGAEKLIDLFENDKAFDVLRNERGLNISNFYKSTNLIDLNEFSPDQEGKKPLGKIFKIPTIAINALKNTFTPNWNSKNQFQNLEEELKLLIEKGNNKEAIKLAKEKLILQLRVEKDPITSRIKYLLKKIYKKIKSSLINEIKKQKIRLLPLDSMYEYSKRQNSIVFEQPPEKFYIDKPNVKGELDVELTEGYATCPRGYISVLKNPIVTGEANLIISKSGDFLNDEMVEFPSEDFGIKSHQIIFRHNNKVLLQTNNRFISIKEGILISCDHNFNYFHWLMEALPKLLFVDSTEKFTSMPLLIPQELHKNLEHALNKINVFNHPIIKLKNKVNYRVNKLVYPSPLSRVLDRYKGNLIFNSDIVLSKQWITELKKRLMSGISIDNNPNRKLFLTRREGLRSVGNLDVLEQMALEKGFEVINPGDFSLEAQIRLFSQAKAVIAPSGAAITNILFCQPNTKVVLFMSNHKISNYYLWNQLGDIAGLDLTILNGERIYTLTNKYSVHDDYQIDPDMVLNEINNIH